MQECMKLNPQSSRRGNVEEGTQAAEGGAQRDATAEACTPGGCGQDTEATHVATQISTNTCK